MLQRPQYNLRLLSEDKNGGHDGVTDSGLSACGGESHEEKMVA
ncbi:MAG: hypothetical protein P8X74_10985 [Reinekea sp.]